MKLKYALTEVKKFSIFWLLTLVYPVTALTQNGYYAESYKQTKPFLYEIEKDGKVSHILGSMHAGIPLNTYPDFIYQQVSKATAVAFEADPSEFQKQYGDQMRAAAVYPEGDSLEKHISPKAVRKLKELFGESAFSKLNKFKPWAVENQIGSEALELLKKINPEANNWEVSNGIDMILLGQSKSANKAITFLDDLSTKITDYEIDSNASDLEKLLSYPDPIAHINNCMLLAQRSYIFGDNQGLAKYNQTCENERFLARIEKRTISWVPKLEPLLKKGDAFITVGAGHIDGPNGLEALLKNKGYKVKRIVSEQPKPQYPSSGVGLSVPVRVNN